VWSARTGLAVDSLRRDREAVKLVLHRDLGDDRARELARLGIHTCDDLARWRPEPLAAALRAMGARGPDRFLERRVRVWLGGLPAPD
jgi:predicted RecB family nuclease